MPEIKVENLKVVYKSNKKKIEDTVALEDFNVTFESGKFNAIVGFSGCGKSTLLRAIAGLTPYEGTISFDGVDGENLLVAERNIAYVSQNYALYPHMTIFDNIAFPLKLLKASREEIIERVYEVAEKLEIKPLLSRKPRQLSGGQQQRVAIARALVKRPSICMFDEPLSNLDNEMRMEARYLIKKVVSSQDMTVLYVTHDFMEAMALSDYIYVINNKKIEVSGTPREVFDMDNEIVKALKFNGDIKDVI